jgi:hypothetical protein
MTTLSKETKPQAERDPDDDFVPESVLDSDSDHDASLSDASPSDESTTDDDVEEPVGRKRA